MSGAECQKKAMYVDRPLFFLRLLRRACLALLTHFALAFALLQKREKKEDLVKRRGFLLLKLAVKKELKRLCQANC